MLVLATALSVIPLVPSIFMPNWYLGDWQNAIEEAVDLVGRRDRRASLPSEDGNGDREDRLTRDRRRGRER